MSVRLSILFFVFCAANLYLTGACCNNLNGYYWREYQGGKIPEDAFIAGQDLNNENIYIAQVCVDNGLMVGYLQANFKEVKVAINGVKTVENNIKVLCGYQENFEWINANATHIHVSLINRQPVIGGFEQDLGTIYIGRKSVDGLLKIGKINSFYVGYAYFYYFNKNISYENIEFYKEFYEVLTYKSQAPIDDKEMEIGNYGNRVVQIYL